MKPLSFDRSLAYAITTDGMPAADWSHDNPGLLLLSRLPELLLDGLSKAPEAKPAASKEQDEARNKQVFDIEGSFHDALGTYAELLLANQPIAHAKLTQPHFAIARAEAKLNAALARLPEADARRATMAREVEYIR